MEKQYSAYTMDIDTYIEIVELAQKNGKKPGESMQAEFETVIKQKSDKVTLLGNTDMDVDLLGGNLREKGFEFK